MFASLDKKIKTFVILYVEDDDITRTQLAQFLTSQCKQLYMAKNGKEGFEYYKKYSPDIVITDIEMSEVNGLSMIRKIRKISLSTKIIIITAYEKPQYLMEAVNLQLTQYLIKPISLKKIANALSLSVAENSSSKIIDGSYKKQFIKNMHYNTYTKELKNEKSVINLSKYERSLLELLIEKHPAPVSYESINGNIYDYSSSKNAIKLLVCSLRKKLTRQSVTSISGFGYKLQLVDEK